MPRKLIVGMVQLLIYLSAASLAFGRWQRNANAGWFFFFLVMLVVLLVNEVLEARDGDA